MFPIKGTRGVHVLDMGGQGRGEGAGGGGGLLMTGNEGLFSHPLSKIRRHNHYGHLYPL